MKEMRFDQNIIMNDSEENIGQLSNILDVFNDCGDCFLDIAENFTAMKASIDHPAAAAAVVAIEEVEEHQQYDHEELTSLREKDFILSFLDSSNFWEEVLIMNEEKIKQSSECLSNNEEVPSSSSFLKQVEGRSEEVERMVSQGLEVINDCADAFQSFQQFALNMKTQDINSLFSLTSHPDQYLIMEENTNIQDFLHHERFWDEITSMQCEGLMKEEEIIEEKEINDELLDKLLDVFNTTAEAISQLSHEHEHVKALVIENVIDPEDDCLPAEILASCQDVSEMELLYQLQEPSAAVEQITSFINSDCFWNEVLEMQQKIKPVPSFTERIADPVVPIESDSFIEQKELKEHEEIQPLQTNVKMPIFTRTPKNLRQALQSSSFADDIKILSCSNVPQINLTRESENFCEAEETVIKMISAEVERKSRKGCNVTTAASMFIIAFATISVVAFSSSVYESPKLFRGLWAAAFAINVVAVSMPGRLDRMYSEGNHVKPWQTLFEPCSWAFAIWGVIYGLELLLTLYVVLIGFPPKLFQVTIPYWLAGNWFQALWCFVFRAEFKKSLWIPMSCLALGAVAYGCAHCVFSVYLQKPELSMPMQALLVSLRLPMSLHSSWLVCGTLLNLNSWVAISVGRGSRGLQVMSAYASAFITALFGVMMSAYSRDPCFALTAAWALDAVSARTLSKAKEPKGIVSADVQESLGSLESMLSGGVKCVAVALIASGLYSFF